MPNLQLAQPLLAHLGLLLCYPVFLAWNRGPIIGVGLLLLGGLFALASLPNKQLNPKQRTLMMLLVSCSVIWFAISYAHGEPASNYDLASRYVLVVPILVLFVLSQPSLSWFFVCCAMGACAAWLVAWSQMDVAVNQRVSGYTGVIQFGDLSLMLGVFSFAGWLYTKAKLKSGLAWFYLFSSGAGLYASFLSGSRGGWIAFPFIAVLFCVGFIHKKNIKFVALLALVMGVAGAVVAMNSNFFQKRVEAAQWEILEYQKGNPDTSIGNRLALWVQTAAVIKENIVIGAPSVKYREVLAQAAVENPKLKNAMGLPNTHNSFLEVLVTSGIVGLVPFMGLLFYGLYGFLSKLRSNNLELRVTAFCGASLIVGYIIFSQSQVMFHRNNTLIFFLISLVYLWAKLYPLNTSRAPSETS
jgi:O-antigen ligase